MGYAEVGQTGEGIHTRQFSRAFIFAKGDKRVVLVTAEVQAVGIAVRREVVKNLQELYGNVYSLQNVIVTGTHTHSAPGGHLVDFILDISILGFSKESYDAYVAGITRSIIRAHENMVPARLYFGRTKVSLAQMNRSPYSYGYNPQEERDRYTTDTDDELTQLRILRADGRLHGVLNWFSVHTTSMNMTNHLISSDNLGYAALRLEEELNPGRLPGKPSVVAGFFASNLGDISPNIRGARCELDGRECDNHFKLCEGRQRCFSQGPGVDMFDSTKIIGTRVYEGASKLLYVPGEELVGEIAVVHQFVEMGEETVPKYDPVTREFNVSDPVSGCVPAMGYSFASGTIDGANLLNITQGTTTSNPLLDIVSSIVATATPEDVACHLPKPILLATGRADFPFPWHPRVVSISVLMLGGLMVAGVPGEPTTMAGRRMKDVISAAMEARGLEPRVVVSSLTNEYIHYVTTFEEYQIQRYEAASTIYGPHTLDIFLNKFREYTNILIEGGSVPSGPTPADYRDNTISLILPVVMDSAPLGQRFGDVIQQPPAVLNQGDTLRVSFVGANPRNDLRQETSHVVVERWEMGNWTVVATDADWNTKFLWTRDSTVLGTSTATFEWVVPHDTITTQYRVAYYGTARRVMGTFSPFTAVTSNFTITRIQA
ncbi:neutral ceramidase-like isoform X2 [Leptidea sinapis]|nr:neutral ceramidase-like isoform X2 [Leptidea sinapis]